MKRLLSNRFVALGSQPLGRYMIIQRLENSTMGAKQFVKVAPMVLLQNALLQYTMLDNTVYAKADSQSSNRIVITREKFNELCALAQVEDPASALAELEDAAAVVSLNDGALVHLRPALYVQMTLAARGERKFDDFFLLEQVKQNLIDLSAKENEMRLQLRPAIARAARWRRSVWGGALCFAGAQLAIISRLTYFDLDWDIMEPVSYLVGIGTALFFYLYFLRYDEEHTYTEFDKRFLFKKVRQYAPKDFNWTEYEKICSLIVEEQQVMDQLKEFSKIKPSAPL